MVSQYALTLTYGDDCVRVFPKAERTTLLNVLKLAPFYIALVPGDPTDGERPIAHLQNYARAILYAPGMFQDLDRRPWGD
jgi:hypothetical protein